MSGTLHINTACNTCMQCDCKHTQLTIIIVYGLIPLISSLRTFLCMKRSYILWKVQVSIFLSFSWSQFWVWNLSSSKSNWLGLQSDNTCPLKSMTAVGFDNDTFLHNDCTSARVPSIIDQVRKWKISLSFMNICNWS